eukprot:TRINITY_DN28549_c0_g1_i2.p1 TRINITY_DN28549_c0_g1~~TRINITY_DN28549_c0_g1_i2.p1  ORF type:complete len:119 (+),score=1.46 TRINITY_DN28549_c0_g1_i2:302-658(+)
MTIEDIRVTVHFEFRVEGSRQGCVLIEVKLHRRIWKAKLQKRLVEATPVWLLRKWQIIPITPVFTCPQLHIYYVVLGVQRAASRSYLIVKVDACRKNGAGLLAISCLIGSCFDQTLAL